MDKHNIFGIKSNIYDCGFCKAEKATLKVPYAIYSQWLWLLNNNGKNEWGGYFTVKDSVVTNWHLPEQEVTSVEVLFKEESSNGYNGYVHSHHSMGAGHSHTDDTSLRNHKEYSIVLTHTSYEASMKKKLPCKGFSYIDVDLEILDAPDLDLSKIKEKEVTAVTSYWDRKDDVPGAQWDKDKGERDFYDFYGYNEKNKDKDLVKWCHNCQADLSEEEILQGEGKCPYCYTELYSFEGRIGY